MREVETVGILTSGGDAPGMNAAIRAVVRTARASGMKVKGIKRGYAGLLNNEIIGINTVGIPGTIDLDINCTDYTIGFDTAVNTAMSAIDKIKDTSTSHERCSIIEVMGRNAGYIALWCQMANGADGILIPERDAFNEQDLIDAIMHNRSKGKTHHVIINAEGVGHTNRLARRIEAATGIETRATVLGHIQRGGSPTARDRVMAATMGGYAIDLLHRGETNRVICYKNGKYVDFDIDEGLAMEKTIDEYQFLISRLMSVY